MHWGVLLFFWTTIALAYTPAQDWKIHNHCSFDSRLNQKYCLELVEISKDNTEYDNSILLLPGLTHNAHIFDIDPKNSVSLARYIEDHFNLKVYILNYRMVGNSEYLPRTNLDDVVIDDVTKAIEYVYQQQKDPIYVVGHSQGAIAAHAALSGLDRCGKTNCFKLSTALKRQKMVQALGLLAGNNRMLIKPSNPIYKIAKLYQMIRPSLYFNDKIDVELVTRTFSSAGKLNIWSFLVNEDNVSDEMKVTLLKKGIDASSVGILDQLAFGALKGNIRNKSGESYYLAGENLFLPVYHQVFGKDPLAPVAATREDTFNQIASKTKYFEVFANQGHEDFLLNPALHSNINSMLKFLKKRGIR